MRNQHESVCLALLLRTQKHLQPRSAPPSGAEKFSAKKRLLAKALRRRRVCIYGGFAG